MIRRIISDLSGVSKESIAPVVLKLIGMAAGYLNIYVITAFFGVEALGAFSFLSTFLMLIGLLGMLGLDTHLLKTGGIFFEQKQWAAYRWLFSQTVIRVTIQAVVLSSLLWAVVNGIEQLTASSLPYSRLLNHVWLILPVYALFYVFNEAQRTRGNNLLYSIGHHAFGGITLMVLLMGLWLGYEDKYFPFYAFVTGLGSLLLMHSFSSFNWLKPPYKKEFSGFELNKRALPFFAISSVTLILNWTDVIMLRVLDSESSVGVYHTVFRLGLLITLPLIALNTFLPPKFAQLIHSKQQKSIDQLVRQSTRFNVLFSLLISIGLILFLPIIANLLALESTMFYTAALILIGAQLISSFFGANASFLIMSGEEQKYTQLLLATAVLNILLNAILIPLYGFTGAAMATALSLVLRNIGAFVIINRTFSIKFILR